MLPLFASSSTVIFFACSSPTHGSYVFFLPLDSLFGRSLSWCVRNLELAKSGRCELQCIFILGRFFRTAAYRRNINKRKFQSSIVANLSSGLMLWYWWAHRGSVIRPSITIAHQRACNVWLAQIMVCLQRILIIIMSTNFYSLFRHSSGPGSSSLRGVRHCLSVCCVGTAFQCPRLML